MSQPEDRMPSAIDAEPGDERPRAPVAEAFDHHLHDEITATIARYPTRRGAILPALRLAQERYGWLSPTALRAVSQALDFSPAYCQSVASFYDMFFLEPVGGHVVEVCTNVACALCGAGEVLEALEHELGISAGETTGDGAITLRTVECLGGCGYAPVVAVDERYREFFAVEDVPALVADVRSAPREAPQ